MPPTMMTAKALMMKREPSCGSIAKAGATSTPAKPAIAVPSAKVASRTRSMAMPEMLASSGAADTGMFQHPPDRETDADGAGERHQPRDRDVDAKDANRTGEHAGQAAIAA